MDPSKTPIQRDSSVDVDEEVKECVPTLSQGTLIIHSIHFKGSFFLSEPSLPPLGDLCISVEGVYPTGLVDLPSTSSHTHSHTSSTFR